MLRVRVPLGTLNYEPTQRIGEVAEIPRGYIGYNSKPRGPKKYPNWENKPKV